MNQLKELSALKIIDSATKTDQLNLRSLCRLLSMYSAQILNKATKITNAPTASRVKSFAAEALMKYSKFHNLKSRFGHLLADGELLLISAIFSLYNHTNKFLFF